MEKMVQLFEQTGGCKAPLSDGNNGITAEDWNVMCGALALEAVRTHFLNKCIGLVSAMPGLPVNLLRFSKVSTYWQA